MLPQTVTPKLLLTAGDWLLQTSSFEEILKLTVTKNPASGWWRQRFWHLCTMHMWFACVCEAQMLNYKTNNACTGTREQLLKGLNTHRTHNQYPTQTLILALVENYQAAIHTRVLMGALERGNGLFVVSCWLDQRRTDQSCGEVWNRKGVGCH